MLKPNKHYQTAAEVMGYTGAHDLRKPVGMASKLVNVELQTLIDKYGHSLVKTSSYLTIQTA